MTATPLSEFWLAIVSTFGALYKANLSVSIPRHDIQTPPTIAQYWIEQLTKTFEGPPWFSGAILFEEEDNGVHDFCAKISRKTTTGSSVINCTTNWNSILDKRKVNSSEKNC